MNDWDVQAKLHEQFSAQLGMSLTVQVRHYLSDFLSEARWTMNLEHKAMIQRTFTETGCWPGGKLHKELVKGRSHSTAWN